MLGIPARTQLGLDYIWREGACGQPGGSTCWEACAPKSWAAAGKTGLLAGLARYLLPKRGVRACLVLPHQLEMIHAHGCLTPFRRHGLFNVRWTRAVFYRMLAAALGLTFF